MAGAGVTHPCQVEGCRRTVGDGAPICTHCTGKLADELRSVPGLLDDLLVTYSRQDRLTSGGGGAGETPLPFREDVPDAVWDLCNTLTAWARDLELGEAWSERHPSSAMLARYRDHALYSAAVAAILLAEHAHLIRTHPAAMEANDELVHAIGRARARTGRPTPLVYRGPCPECGEEMQARPGADIVTCRGCKTDHEGRDLKDWLLQAAADYLATTEEISRALTAWSKREVKVGTIRSWKARGQLAPHGWLHDGQWVLARPHAERCCRPLFRLGDAATLVEGPDPA